MQSVGREVRGVAAERRESADRLVDVGRADPRRAQDLGSLDELRGRRGGGAGGRAALRPEGHVADAPVIDRE